MLLRINEFLEQVGFTSPNKGIFEVKEAALALGQSHKAKVQAIRQALLDESGVKDPWEEGGPYLLDVFEGHAVYEQGGKMYKRKYSASQKNEAAPWEITFGSVKPVHVAYVDSPTQESLRFAGFQVGESDQVRVTESVVTTHLKESAGVVEIKVIQAGWGSKGYYPAEVLKRDGPSAFPAKTHMYVNHATTTEESERPERDVKDLAASLTTPARWKDNGADGPGLYAFAKLFEDHSPMIKDKADDTGVSIAAYVTGSVGEREGRTGFIIDRILGSDSVDFVTKAGAGGKIVGIQESVSGSGRKEKTMIDETVHAAVVTENSALKAAVASLTKSNGTLLARESLKVAFEKEGIEVPAAAITLLAKEPELENGIVKESWTKDVVDSFKGFFKTGETGVKGMGTKESAGPGVTAEEAKKVAESFESALTRMGLPESVAKAAVR